MPPGGFGPDPRYPAYPVHHPHQAYPAAAMMPVRPSYVVEEHASVAAQNLVSLWICCAFLLRLRHRFL